MYVKHLYHSGCLIKLEHHQLLFDYYQGTLTLDPTMPLYIFVSHKHHDHFNLDIFNIQHPNITYILSSDIKQKYPAYYVDPNQTYTIDDLHIQTLLSTDEGCAFVVEVENKTIYHAGDLHWWHWEGESDKDNLYQKETYQSQINLIKQPIDIAFVVVDYRLNYSYTWGLEYFLTHTKTRYVFPIHYFGNYFITKQLLNESINNPHHTEIILVTHKNQLFRIT